jgi:choline dehydrogenase
MAPVAESRESDYVIVGAGSAGCVLANRLSEDPSVNVRLIEAGGSDRDLKVRMPAAFANQFHTRLDWDFATEPEPAVDGRSLYVPRGKMLGGSSSMNAMLYARGRPLDYDLWQEQGATGWGWKDVLPYFLRSEDNVRGASEFHGAGGELRVSEQRSPRADVDRRLIEACVAAGIPRIADYNGPEQDGVAMAQVTQRDGRRWSCADGFLRPALKRPNLELISRATVVGLEFEGERATGVRYRRRGREHVAGAGREVILAAGAIGSPQILLLSGIGPGGHLREVGVDVSHELPGVGRNLHDHPFVTVLYELARGPSLYRADSPRHLAEWLLRRTGPLTSTAAEVFAFVRSRPGLPAPDLQFHMGGLYFDDHGQEEFEGHAMTIAPVLVATKSRGAVWLRSADPHEKPRILTNSLSEPDDVDSLVAGIELAREIAAKPPLADLVEREIKPGPDAGDRDALEADLRRRLMLLYHPVGTCRMSDTGADAVVDSELRVHGIDGLRVADASVMPTIPGGNTNAPTIMIGEKASDLIRGRAPAGPA